MQADMPWRGLELGLLCTVLAERTKNGEKDPGETRGGQEKREKQKRAQRGPGKGSRKGPGRE